MSASDWINQLFAISPDSWEVDLIVVTDWSDGPRDGFCRLRSPNCCFRFELIAERLPSYDDDLHLFRLSAISHAEFGALLTGLKSLGPPRQQQVWIPRWTFSSEKDRQEADQAVKAAIEASEPSVAIIQTHNMLDFTGAWLAMPSRRAQ